MPDISKPIFVPSSSNAIFNIDLSRALNQKSVETAPVDLSKANVKLNSGIAFAPPKEEFSAPLRVFDEKLLAPVSGYNSFNERPTYNPEFTSMQNLRDYASKQGSGEYAYNTLAKLSATVGTSFINAFAQNKRNIDALTSFDVDKLYDKTDTSLQLEELRNKYPTHGTGELDDSWRRFNPFEMGKSDFYGEFVPQLGFTIGTIGETILENMAITAVTGGLGTAGSIAMSAGKFTKLFKGMNNLFESANAITNFKKSLQVINSIQHEGTLGATVGEGLIKGAKLLANGYAMFNTAAGESSFEANHVYNEHIAELTNEFREKNGHAPLGNDLIKIKNSASQAAIATFGWNMPVLLASNLVQFGNILKPFKGQLAESLEREALQMTGKGLSKSVERVATKELESKFNKIFGSVAKAVKEPVAEGWEEVTQSFASRGSSAYYKDLYHGLSEGTALNSAMKDIWEYSHTSSFTDEFVGGFLGGAVFSGVGKLADVTKIRNTKFGQKFLGDSDATKEKKRNDIANSGVELLNSIDNETLLKHLYKPEMQNLISQVSNSLVLHRAAISKDKLAYMDSIDKSSRDLIYYGLKTGRLDLALAKLDVFKELDNDELAAVLKIEDKNTASAARESVQSRVNEVKERAIALEADWNTINRKYPNKYPEGSREYIAYEEAKRDRLFARDIVEQDRKRARKLRSDIANVTQGHVNDYIIDQAVDNNNLTKQIESLDFFIKEAPDKTDPVYISRKKQLEALREIEKIKAKKDVDYHKMASLLIEIGDANTPSPSSLLEDEKQDVINDIADALKIEDRHFKNLQDYNILNNRPLDIDYYNHLMTQDVTLSAIREESTKGLQQLLAERKTEENSSQIPAEVMSIVGTDDNYNSWSNLRDRSDYEQFLDAIRDALALLGKGDITKYSREQIDDMLKSMKIFANKDIRSKMIDYLLKNVAPKSLILLPPSSSESEQQKEEEERMNDGAMKLARIKFSTDKSPRSEDLAEVNAQDPQFHRRKDRFLENLHLQRIPKEGSKKFWKRDELRVLIVTPSNVGKYGKNLDTLLKDKSDNVDTASIMFLIVNEDLQPITLDGRLLPKLDGTSDYNIEDLIYSFNETSLESNYKKDEIRLTGEDLNSLDENDEPIVISEDEAIAKMIDRHRRQRKKWLTAPADQLQPFQISHGLPNMEKKDGKVRRIKNSLQDVSILPEGHIFLPDDIYISTSKDDFEVVGTDSSTNRYLRPGRPYLAIRNEDGNIIDYQKLENSLLTESQKSSVLNAFKGVIDDFFANEQKVVLNESNDNYNFLHHVLFLQGKDVYKDENSVQIQQNVKEGTITIAYDFSKPTPQTITFHTADASDSIADNGGFKEWLDKRYLNVRKGSTKTFTEITPNGKTRVWDNYAQFLMDSKKFSRPTEEIPLKVEIYTPKQQEDYYKGGNKYPTIRKQYYVQLGNPIRDDKGTPVKKKEKATSTPPPPSSGGLAALLRARSEGKNDPVEQSSSTEEIKLSPLAARLREAANSAPADEINDIIEAEPVEQVVPEVSTTSSLSADEIFDIDADDIPSRPYTRVYTQISNYTKENLDEIRAFFKKNLPQVSVETTENLIKLADGKLAWGTFQGSVVRIYEEAEAGTGYHEAFETVFNAILTKNEQNNLVKEFKKRKGTFSNFATDGDVVSYKNATDTQAREELAEEFLRFKLNGTAVPDTRNIFQKILDFIMNFVRNMSSISDVFSKLDNGFYANKELRSTPEVFSRGVIDVSPTELGQYLKGMTYEMVNKLFADTKSFTQFDEGFNEKKLYNDLYNHLYEFYTSTDTKNPDTYFNVLRSMYSDKIKEIQNNKDITDEQKAKLKSPINIEFSVKLKEQRERFLNVIAPQWENIIDEHKKYLKQLGVITFTERTEEENDNEEEANSNDYIKNDFKIDIKNTAPRSIKLLFNTIAESTFNYGQSHTLANGLDIPLIQPKIVNSNGLVNLYDNGGELFNIVLSQVAGINTLDGIKEKLETILGMDKIKEYQKSPEELKKYFESRINEEQYKNNSLYVHLLKLYSRIFATPEHLLTKQEWQMRLKFHSTFSKSKPEFMQLVTGEQETFMMDELRDSGRRQMISRWMGELNTLARTKAATSLLKKFSKKDAYVINTVVIDKLKAIPEREVFITQMAKALGISQINGAFLENLTVMERNNLHNNFKKILDHGVIPIWNGREGVQIFNKLTPNNLTVSTQYNEIADLILDKRGDEVDSIHSNIEGEQQQNIILNNEITNRLASFNRHDDLRSYVNENPEFNDTFVNSSVLLNKLFPGKGKRNKTFNPKYGVFSGTRESTRERGLKSSNLNLAQRLFQEFNANLGGVYTILLNADSETEAVLSVGQDTYIEYKDDVYKSVLGAATEDNVFLNYLKSEIEVAQEFINPEHKNYSIRNSDDLLSKIRPLRDGSERKVGASLQIFKDILSDGTVARIHEAIDNLIPVDAIIAELQSSILPELQTWIEGRVDETFTNLNRAKIVERRDVKEDEFDDTIQPSSEYIFYGMNSAFNRVGTNGTRFPLNLVEKTRGKNTNTEVAPNQYILTSKQLRNVIAYREMSYMINNIEMTKLFVGNPYFYKDIQKRVKSFLSTTEGTYVQHEGSKHKADDWFNRNLNNVENKGNVKPLPSGHIHRHTFTSSIKAWVFKDHTTLNKEVIDALSKTNPTGASKYAENNATDAQSFITPNVYREFYWKSGAKFRDAQEKQFQLEQAFERMLMDEDGVYEYTDAALKSFDQKLLQGHIKQTKNGWELTTRYKDGQFEVFKPKGSGTLGGLDTFDPYLWKTSVAMINYRMVRNTPLMLPYLKMLNEGVGVLTFESAVKVGMKKDPRTGKVNSLVDVSSFENLGKTTSDISSFIHEFPFKSVGLQVETSTQKNKATIGTQTTKLILTDLFEYGVPVDFMKGKAFGRRMNSWHKLSEEQKLAQSKFYDIERRHRAAIENLENVGYYDLLQKLGIKEVIKNGERQYEYDDLERVYSTLKDEMVKRGLSSNIYDMFEDVSLDVKPVEALANYAQASFIIMSIVRKSIIKPKLNGGQKIQASSVLLNDLQSEGLTASYNDGKNWVDVSEDNFAEAKKKGIVYNSPQLKFYSQNANGELNVMEVMLPNIYRDKLNTYRKAKGLPLLSDEQLLDWLNKNQSSLLKGVGFRIPTQALSSIDTFVIKKFLPSYFGDTIVVPSEITTKAGSDFDVDKLNTYLNNYFINEKGYPEYATVDLEEGEKANERRWKRYSKQKRVLALIEESVQELTQREIIKSSAAESFVADIAEMISSDDKIEDILQELDENISKEVLFRVLEANEMTIDILEALRDRVANLKSEEEFKALSPALQNSKGALENLYFSTVDEILHLPQNFDKLLSPNHSDEFTDAGAFRDKIMTTLGIHKEDTDRIPSNKRKDYINYSNIIDSNKMRYSRWAFVIGKKGVGIAALSATNHVNSQKIGFKLNRPVKTESSWWSDGLHEGYNDEQLIKFKHNTISIGGKDMPVISGVTKTEGQNISEFVSKYVNGYVDVSKDAWILDIGAQTQIAGIYMFLERMGVNTEEIIYFLNQPAIKYYLNATALRNSPIRYINPAVGTAAKETASDEQIYAKVKELLIGKTGRSVKPIDNFSLSHLKTDLEKFSKIPLGQWNSGNNGITTATAERQLLVLRHFLQLKDYSNYIRASQAASNHDTTNLNSLHILDDKEKKLSDLLGENADVLISSIEKDMPMALALTNDTFVKNIKEKLNSVDENFLSTSLFRIQNKSVRMKLREVMSTLVPSLFSENDKRDMMDKISKITINSLVMNTDINGKGKLIDSMEAVMRQDSLRNTISKVQDILKNPDGTYKQQLKDANIDLAHIISNKWINQLIVEPLAEGSDYGYLSISGKKPNDNFEKQIWIDDFKKLKALPFTQNLYKAILAASMYQTGAETNRVSLLDIIPWQDYTPIINNGLNNLDTVANRPVAEIARTIAKLKASDRKFFTPLDKLPMAKVNGKPAYAAPLPLKINNEGELFFDKAGKIFPPGTMYNNMPTTHWIYPAAKDKNKPTEREISSLIMIPYSEWMAKQSYFTLRQPHSSYTYEEIKKMKKAKNFDYLTTVLFEKAPMMFDNGIQQYMIYRPLNTTGHRYMQELRFDNEYSKIDTNERVNPLFANDEEMFRLLSQRFPGKIVKSGTFITTSSLEIDEQQEGSEENDLSLGDMDSSTTAEFDKLPSKSSTPTMTYAGIGSRETPPEVLSQMTELAKELDKRGYTLRSGGAAGADSAFEKGATKKEIFKGSDKTGPAELAIAREIHPNPNALDNSKNPSFIWNLMARNTNQVFGKNLDTPVDFVVAWTKDGLTNSQDRTVNSGGTGQAIDMASRKGIPVINLKNANWREELDRVLGPIEEIEETDTNSIYYQLGDKTVSENVVIRPLSELSNKGGLIQSTQGQLDFEINALRNSNSKEHFGNPFDSKNTQGTIRVGSTKEAVEKFIDWVLSEKTDIEPQRHKWIREQLQNNAYIKNSPILYYKELGEPSHATALDYLINKYDWGTSFNNSNLSQTLNNYLNADDNYIDAFKELTEEDKKIIADVLGFKDTNFSVTSIESTEANNLLKSKLIDYKVEEKAPVIIPTETKVPATKKEFTYKGKTIPTEFVLGEDQRKALETLIDFVNEGNDLNAMTLQGAAGTGKTAVIGYLQKYFKTGASFAYMAPTHAATAELGFATVKTGNTMLPATVASAVTFNAKKKRNVFSLKVAKRLGLNPVIVVDESSMLDIEDIEKLIDATDDVGGRIIFLGDNKQIPKVVKGDPKTKAVSPVFTDFDKVVLNKIFRQSNNSLLFLLSRMRAENDFKLYKVPNSDAVKFVNRRDYNQALIADLLSTPEDTTVIAYTNEAVKGVNVSARKVLGREGQTIPGDILMGYLGYASKQIEKGDVANSISYTLTRVTEQGPVRHLEMTSRKLKNLITLGIDGITERASTNYYQLSKNDSLTFDNLTEKDFENNNKEISRIFRTVHKGTLAMKAGTMRYVDYLAMLTGVSDTLRKYSIGDTYVYNPASDMMEKYDALKHKNIQTTGQGSLLFEKDIDYGHAITIHKSQGATIPKVYFDTTSIGAARNTPVIDTNGNKITTERQALAYVAMSRSSQKLTVYESDQDFEMLDENAPEKKAAPIAPNVQGRQIPVDNSVVVITPNGDMIGADGKKITDQVTINKVNVRRELQDGTLRLAKYRDFTYYILSDNRIVSANPEKAGQEPVTKEEIKKIILTKAVKYKKEC